MKCFKCGADAPAGNKFCPHCGASMSIEQSVSTTGPVRTNQGIENTRYQSPENAGQGNYVVLDGMVRGTEGNSAATASMVLGIIADVALIIILMLGSSAVSKQDEYYGFGAYMYHDDINMLASMAGILGFAAVICSIIGFILAIYSLKKKTTKKGRAIAGLVCNSILVIPMLFFMFVLLFI